jgi:hypothetical protein
LIEHRTPNNLSSHNMVPKFQESSDHCTN